MDELIALIKGELDLGVPIDPGTPLLSSGIVTSFQTIRLLKALERRYEVAIDPAEVGVDNFDTAEQIERFLRAYR